jgi:hypothetical protein
MTTVDVALIILGVLTLLAATFSVGLMLGQRHQRLRIVDVSVGVPKVIGSNFATCLIIRVMNPGSRPVVVQEAGLTLENGEDIGFYPEPVVDMNGPFSEPLPPFKLTDGEASNLYRQANGGVCQYLAENKGMGGQRVRFRPFVRYALGKRRRADTWWTVDVDSAEFTPDEPGRFRRLLVRVQHALQ